MPDWKPEIRRRLAGVKLEPARESAIIEELAQYLDDCYVELLAGGAEEAEAYRQTLAELSGGETLQHELPRLERQVMPDPIGMETNRRSNMVRDLWRDLCYGLRTLLKNPGFTAIATLTLALGICGVTAQFSVFDAALLRGLPFPKPDRLMRVAMRDPAWAPERDRNPWMSDILEFQKQEQSFEGLAGYIFAGAVMVTINDAPQRLSGCQVTSNFFDLLGVKPALGRDFIEADNSRGAESVAIISDALWRSDFGGDPNVIGRVIRVEARPTTVIGVMPPGFEFPRDQIWIPIFSVYPYTERPWGAVNALARLKPGVSLDHAHAEFGAYLNRLAKEYPRTNERFTVPLIEPVLNNFIARPTRQLLVAMLGAVLALLIIACANVMNMQFARAATRASEFVVRSALGASRLRLVRQILAESLLLATIGGVAGVVLAHWAVGLFSGIMGAIPVRVAPYWMQFHIDRRVLAGALAATIGSVLLSTLLPALLASRANLAETLKAGARGHTSRLVSRLTSSFVIGQIGLTCALLISSLLLIKSVTNQFTLNFGFDLDGELAGRLSFDAEYRNDDERRVAFRQLLTQLRSNPQLTAAAFTTRRNMLTNDNPLRLELEGQTYIRPEDRIEAWVETVSDGYFAALGLRPLQGREFEPEDREGRRFVAMVNESFARGHFGGVDPIGRRLRFNERDQWRTIIGVVPDTLMQGPMEQRRDGAGVFLSIEADPPSYLTLVARGHAPPPQLAETVRREILKVNPDLGIYSLGTPRELMKTILAQPRATASLFAVFGGVAMLLAAIGLYGVTAFSVSRRTQEFGVRTALGASRRDILLLVLRHGGAQSLIGTVTGLGLTIAIVRLGRATLSSLLYRVDPYDPLIYGAVILLLGAAMLLACLVPARRATKVDPLIALRFE
ncbi:MAG: ABC transporter permease [Chloracidobacterium sp.]|nr:ABC transporter permease [Chloracidobacterium sp.]